MVRATMRKGTRRTAGAAAWAVAVLGLAAGTAAAQVPDSTFEGMAARLVGPSGTSGRIAAVDAWGHPARLIYAGAATDPFPVRLMPPEAESAPAESSPAESSSKPATGRGEADPRA